MATHTKWYRVGTVGVTANSTAITGKNTLWTAASIQPGDMFTTNDGESFYEVLSVTDDTHLELKTPYTGESATNITYGIVRQFNATLPAQIAAWVSDLLLDYDTHVNEDMSQIQGHSAYEVAVSNGYVGTESEWLESLKAGGEWEKTRESINKMLEELSEAESSHVEMNDRIAAIKTLMGDLAALTTTNKGTLTSAINEVKSNTTTNAGSIGGLTSLTTQAKASLVGAINEVDAHTDENTRIIGDLTRLRTDAKDTVLLALNEVDAHTDENTAAIGAIEDLTTTAKTNTVSAINELETKHETTAEQVDALKNQGTEHEKRIKHMLFSIVGANTWGPYFNGGSTNYGTHPTDEQIAAIRARKYGEAGLFLDGGWYYGGTVSYTWTDVNGEEHTSTANKPSIRIIASEPFYGIHGGHGNVTRGHVCVYLDSNSVGNYAIDTAENYKNGYANCAWRTGNGKARALGLFKWFFGDYLLTYSAVLCNQIDDNGVPTGFGTYNCDVELMTAEMLGWHAPGREAGTQQGTTMPQFSIGKRGLTFTGTALWLRSVGGAPGQYCWAAGNEVGYADCTQALGIQPFALVG